MSLSLCLTQALGFLLQTLPLVFLCFAPFDDEHMRMDRGKILTLATGCLLALAAGFAILHAAMYDPLQADNLSLRSVTNLYMAACLGAGICVFFANLRVGRSKKLLVLVCLIHYAAVLYALNRVLFTYLPKASSPRGFVAYDLYDCMLAAALMLVTFPLVCCFFKRCVRPGLAQMENRTLRTGFRFLVLSLLLYVASLFVLTNFYYVEGGVRNGPILMMILVLSGTDGLLYFLFFYDIALASRNHALNEQLRSFDERYRQINASIEEFRRARHDLKHHLGVISTLNAEGKQRELQGYLQKYIVLNQELDHKPLSQCSAVDNVLNYYLERARQKKITVDLDVRPVKGDQRFDVMDMTVLIGNLMENAIEACQRMPEGEPRRLRVWMRESEASLLFQIENSCPETKPEQPEFSSQIFPSTKHAVLRGQGMKSVCSVAEKYGGSAEFKRSGGMFAARVVLNNP